MNRNYVALSSIDHSEQPRTLHVSGIESSESELNLPYHKPWSASRHFFVLLFKVETDRAYLVSPFYKYNKTSTKCIEFWYHAYGEDIGTLKVYKLLPNGISFLSELLFTTSGEQGEEW